MEENKQEDKQIPEEQTEELISWEVPEYQAKEKTGKWYLVAGGLGMAMLIWALLTANFLFALIIIIGTTMLILIEEEKHRRVEIILSTEGIWVGKNFYDYDEFKNFSIVYKPKQGVKNLYFEFNSFFKHRITIPLKDTNPIKVRDILSDFLEEDTSRTNPPLSEQLSQIFRL